MRIEEPTTGCPRRSTSRWASSLGPPYGLRPEFGALAKILSQAAKRFDVWSKALEGWNVVESKAVLEWQAEGEARGRAQGASAMLTATLSARFGELPDDLTGKLNAAQDLATLQNWAAHAVRAGSLDEFRSLAGL